MHMVATNSEVSVLIGSDRDNQEIQKVTPMLSTKLNVLLLISVEWIEVFKKFLWVHLWY